MNLALASPGELTPRSHRLGYTPRSHHQPGITVDRHDIDVAVNQEDVSSLLFALQHVSRHTHDSDPVWQAVSCNHLGALELLLRSGYSARGQGGVQSLRSIVKAGLAKDSDEYRMAELLLQRGIKPDDPEAESDMDADGCMSLLGLAVQQQCVLGTELLLSYGADPNRVNAHGKTPLHTVCEAACPPEPLSMWSMFQETDGLDRLQEFLDLDPSSLTSLQGAMDMFDNMPLTMPPLSSLVGSAARAQPALASAAADPLQSANVLHSLRDGSLLQPRAQDGSNLETGTKSSELLPLGNASRILELLLRQGANAGARDNMGRTPAELLHPPATQLRAKLHRAEDWLRQKDFISACSPLYKQNRGMGLGCGEKECPDAAVIDCLGQTHHIEAIARFL
eukprot:TRINITY_DN4657_c0_g1_i4.p1 TRINITY_DN4657_c0_g1~~TRINITY_DN4657_c0_g1_i4.p1  ORF type:complete len:394 (+),score=56.42 TRINITY_DN4657_c0_g1_i4:107-1288(+)